VLCPLFDKLIRMAKSKRLEQRECRKNLSTVKAGVDKGGEMKRQFIPMILAFVSLVCLTRMSWTAVFTVSTAAELQSALTAAETNGEDDIVKVVQGTYYGNFIFDSSEGYSITLLGGYTAGGISRVINPENTILDGGGSGRVLYLENSGGGGIFLEGFTIQNGNPASLAGGGIYARSWSSYSSGNISFINNHILNNTSVFQGGGIWAESFSDLDSSGDIIVSNNRITGNTAKSFGGGVFAKTDSLHSTVGDVVITDNIIAGNSVTEGAAGLMIAGGLFAESYGFNGPGGDVSITNNTITGNNASDDQGGGLVVYGDSNLNSICNNIIWNNSASSGDDDIYLFGSGSFYGFHNDYTVMSGNSWTKSGGNINLDPQFVGGGDYHLRSVSPCIDAGMNTAPDLPDYDFDGNPRIIYGKYDGTADVDIGAYEYVHLPVFDGHDFDGDNTSDIAVWRPSSGRWYIRGIGVHVWGTSGDVPVNGDYNGDGTTDIAVWRPSNGRWYLKDIGSAVWGTAGDVPVPGDYDGDGTTDMAVWRPSNGRWYIKGVGGAAWGTDGDIPVPGDYDGDGTTDIAVLRPSNGRWYIMGIGGSYWGTAGDLPVPADYNDDGITEIAVWRPFTGRWYIKSIGSQVWGTLGDMPVPGDYDGDGVADLAVWRPSNGRWYIKGVGVYLWGILGDIPLVR
jgi:hypothetical protein